MAKLVPYYTVSYRGEYHKAGQAFEIHDGDVEEMRQHGTIIPEKKAQKAEPVKEEPAKRKRGAPKKNT